MRLAKAAREASVPHCSLLTSVGSNPNSWFLYTKTKGQLEEAIRGMSFSYTSVFRPGLLSERGNVQRWGEKIASKFNSHNCVLDAYFIRCMNNYSVPLNY